VLPGHLLHGTGHVGRRSATKQLENSAQGSLRETGGKKELGREPGDNLSMSREGARRRE